MKSLLLFFVIFFSIDASAIVDTETKYAGRLKEKSYIAELGFSYNQRSGNTETKQIDLDSIFIYQISKSQITFANEGSYGISLGESNSNKFFSYIKYSYKLYDNFALETLTQFEFDEFKKLLFRGLVTFGFNWSIVSNDSYLIKYRVSHMPEYEKYTTGEKGWNQRMSNNIIFSYIGLDIFSFDLSCFYQPRYDRWVEDYRLASLFVISVDVTEYLAFRVSYKIHFDSEPVAGVKRTDSTFKNSLVFKF